ncbi:MAG: GyrI-like domain-containing protein [Candidatus Bathyarchaeota archaeon]|nr:GyrI-like domain-containing protein [Candidatus Bathyarchaeota archaeon]
MSKVDLSRELKDVYKAKKEPALIDVPVGKFLAIDGTGDPNGEEYQEAMMALYGSAYTLKFHYNTLGSDFKVMALEGLWWIENGVFDMNNPAPRENWRWTSMIRVPNYVTQKEFDVVLPAIIEKRGEKVKEVRLMEFDEGLSAQIMHIGPYSEETPTINRLHNWVTEQGYRLRDKHHEIYMSDPRRTAPEKLKTIIRHPVTR